MNTKQSSHNASAIDQVWKSFASVKLTIGLLLTLAATSIIGTLIPQNEAPGAYLQTFGETLYRVFSLLGLFDMYHSWWFRAMILLLVVNIVVCSIDRLQATWKIIFARNPRFKVARYRQLKNKIEFNHDSTATQLKERYLPVISGKYRYHRTEDTNGGFALYAEKGRLTRLGVYVVHLSVVVLLIGGLIGSIFGFEGFVNLAPGESSNSIRLRNNNQTLPLGFEIRCDEFKVEFYDSGAPKEFRASLSILKQGKVVKQKDIIVNDPLHFDGLSFFQASYGQLSPTEMILNFTSQATGMIYSQKAAIGKPVEIPEKLGTFTLKEFTRQADFKGHNIGEAFIGELRPPNGNPVSITLPLKFPSFDKMRKGQVLIAIADFVPRYYTGLQVSKDPGVWVVYTGFILMIIGIYITFFMSHQQLCVEVAAEGPKSKVMVAGKANKNKMGMQKRVMQLVEQLENLPPLK
jgi:cytochrome c biogenesis protein